MKSLLFIAIAIGSVNAAVPLWGQCGGLSYTGETTCVSGATCVYLNYWYSQCLASSTTVATSTSRRTTISTSTSRSTTTSASTFSGTTTTSTSTTVGPASTAPPLANLAISRGKRYFGLMLDTSEMQAAANMAIASTPRTFNQATPSNTMKWDYIEPARRTFQFTGGNALVDWAVGGSREVRGHTLVWHSQLPAWVQSAATSNATLVSVLEDHIRFVAGHFAGNITAWNVVNEIFQDDGTWRPSIFYKTIGEYFVDIAFRAAATADPVARLAANDYNLDSTGPKVTAYVNLIQRLKSRGVKITEVGSQAHLISGSVPSYSAIASGLVALVAAGVDVAITELDIRIQLPVTSAKLAQQRIDYNTVTRACLAVPRCVGITIAGISDRFSFVPITYSGYGAALPWDENYQPKPALTGIVNALNGIVDS